MSKALRMGSLVALGAVLTFGAPAHAQGKGSEEEKSGEDSADKGKDEGDVVLDNRDMSKKKREAREQEMKEDPSFASDNPFADSAPDPEALREKRWKPGFGGGYRLGFALPMGELVKGTDFTKVSDGLIFLWGDFGYWPIPYLFAGVYASGGYVLPDADLCSGNASCSSWEVRGGPEVIGRFMPFANITPFLGLAAGYEWWKFKYSVPTGASSSVSYTGFELLNVQAGLEVRSRGDFYSIFMTYSLGKFSHYSSDSDSGSIDAQGTHSWLGIGARGTIE
jgi:hypothetical protein